MAFKHMSLSPELCAHFDILLYRHDSRDDSKTDKQSPPFIVINGKHTQKKNMSLFSQNWRFLISKRAKGALLGPNTTGF